MAQTGAGAFRAALEDELSWRRDEIRNLRNLGPQQGAKPHLHESHRRALIVMLYAHLEGFVRFSFEQYAVAINSAKVSIKDAKPQLCAACLDDRFKSYRSSDASDPYDPHGNRARQVMKDAALIAEVLDMQLRHIKLPIDIVSSVESNLSPVVFRRSLALLALDDTEFHKFVNALEGLLKLRNNIAHGKLLNLPSDPAFRKVEARIFDLCETLMRAVYESVRDEAYRR
ncbi:MAG: MAE_28990/MAE_18760 family HEPN-like nuclease [Gammaproteobacteria bacterium]